jgi:F-box/leucine-rich repeat protein 2/20
VEEINLEFAQGLQDEHLSAVKFESLQRLNLNACQKITDSGVKAVASTNPNLKLFSIYWNLKVTDVAIESVVMSCKHLTALNVSGCKNITDASLQNIAEFSPSIKSLNLTRLSYDNL